MKNKAYPVPQLPVRTEDVIKKSRFICDICRVQNREEAKAFISAIKNEFPDARHHCSAFIAGPPLTGNMGMSDDGEPQGTAGKPMLQVLQGSGIGDIGVVVTRYFGGILLGTGGLVRAYSGAVQQGLEALTVVMKVPMRVVTVEIGYGQEGMLRRMLDDFKANIEEQTFGADITFSLIMPSDQVESFTKVVIEETSGTAEIMVDDEDVWL
ncbi:YigZ family protein [Maridesulfovibrio frigidus]|uniref:YigZ family protein n=1 Tax=Maridesulfovibrio frigidus TaxID=340956 RepID=UPI0004E1A696|nr:YigZ family protein [Maridesulfovibrio frigidus]